MLTNSAEYTDAVQYESAITPDPLCYMSVIKIDAMLCLIGFPHRMEQTPTISIVTADDNRFP